jgi:hypothetical protein
MGDATSGPVRVSFNPSFNPQLRVEFRGATVTSDAGLLLPRELDERLGLSTLIDRHLTDPRTGHNRQFPLPDHLRQSIYSGLPRRLLAAPLQRGLHRGTLRSLPRSPGGNCGTGLTSSSR